MAFCLLEEHLFSSFFPSTQLPFPIESVGKCFFCQQVNEHSLDEELMVVDLHIGQTVQE